ncbi:MAG: Fic family protein [Candidatus Binatia bacterium]
MSRAGVYVKQPTGYRAFIPTPLPPDPPIQYDAELLDLLSKADQALGRLDGMGELLPNPDLFVAMYIRKEAVLSSQIEGTRASLVDVLEFESTGDSDRVAADVGEVVNYVNAMNYGLERLTELPLSLRLMREIHARLLAGVRGEERSPGEFRHSQNWIGPPGCDLMDATFIPPPPHQMKDALNNLEKYIHRDTQTPILVKVGLVHAQFETIHPFLDGNGRLGRLLITFMLCQTGMLSRPLLYLSYYLNQHRDAYYAHLMSVRDQGDWEGWLKFFLQGVREVSHQATETAKRIQALRAEHRRHLQAQNWRVGSALNLLDKLYYRPIVSVNTVADMLDLTFAGASRLVSYFETEGLLREITGQQRNRRFAYGPYLDILMEN